MHSATPDVKSVFGKALEIPSMSARAVYLDRVCNGNGSLRAEVDGLLHALDQAGSFLKGPAAALTTPGAAPSEGPGTRIGPYKLLQQLGEGGMGVVYMAEQEEPLRRRVALKIIKPGMDSAQVIARFEVERQALALMDHPNIARVLDAGTTESGRPYFVMELVHGVPITQYCDANKLSPRQRLELFIPVCRAIQHAHQKGIIHRDLKPSNVMVTLHDGKPVSKVIDFGVAKATEQRLTERTLFTQYGTIVGTLEYMAPEQAEMSGLGVDTRSDVYALGVLLYELLTGTTPLERTRLRAAAYNEMLRLIREEEPPRPSRRISTSGDRLATISAERSTQPARLSRLVCGELDWIVMRCLEKDRTRRYDTASNLARDLERYLADEPVEAGPPSAGYKLRKIARKYKAGLATAAGFAALLVLVVAGSAWQAVRATQAEVLALANEQQANANAAKAEENEQDANQQRDQAKQQRDEVRVLNDRLRQTLYAAHMNLAQQAWDVGGIERALELLQPYHPKAGESDLRSFEWHYLNRLCHSDLLTLRYTGIVQSVAFSPDGKRLASASSRFEKGTRVGEVRMSDAQTGRELLTLKHDDVVSLVFSLDGKRLATASTGRRRWGNPPAQPQHIPGEVKVWDAQTGQELLTLKDSDGLGQVVFSPDGKRLARGRPPGSHGGQVRVWDAQTGQEALTLTTGLLGQLHSVAFSPDGKRLATAMSGAQGVGQSGGMRGPGVGGVKVWELESGKEVLSLKGSAASLVFSPDGQRLASAGGDTSDGAPSVRVWDARTGQELFSLKSGDNWSVAFSPDGQRLAGTSEDGKTVKVWDAQTGKELLSFKGHTEAVVSVAFSPDGKRLASASHDKTVKLWDAEIRQEPIKLSLEGSKGERYNLYPFSPDGKRLASASLQGDGTVRVWDAQTGQELLTSKADNRRVRAVAFSPDGRRMAISRDVLGKPSGPPVSHELTVCDAQTGQELLTWKPAASVDDLVVSPDGKRLAGNHGRSGQGQRDEELKVWDAQTGQELLNIKGRGYNPVFSPDGKCLAAVSGGGTPKVWDMQTGQELLTFKGHKDYWVESVAFSPDGKRVASASEDKTVRVWDAQTGQELLTYKGHTGEVSGVAFSPDGKRLASAGEDKLVKVWDAQTGQELLTLKLPDKVWWVIFSPDGHRLSSVSQNGIVKIWDATPLGEKP
jgi:WD40 repeat protein/serine/threonine protein kinase